MKSLAEEVWSKREANEDDEGANEAKKFIELFDKNFYKRVGSQSLKSKMDTAAKKKQILIKDEDVKKINYGLLNDIEEEEKELIANPCEKTYFKLMDSLEAYKLVYNRKRAGDIGKYFDIFLLTLFKVSINHK